VCRRHGGEGMGSGAELQAQAPERAAGAAALQGLGEMSPEQLCETTLDPARPAMMQVKVGHAEEADEIFSTLMGDVVEPRRELIQDNALKVLNLDV
jgi:DNA gyrase/topoisomerase IV subunit B